MVLDNCEHLLLDAPNAWCPRFWTEPPECGFW